MDFIDRNRRFLRDLFAGPFRGHALVTTPPDMPAGPPDDYSTSARPVKEWAPYVLARYEAARRWHESIDDDHVPYLDLRTHTGVFAACFGCPMHAFEGSNDAARPIVFCAEEADRLPQPRLDSEPIERYFALADAVHAAVPEAPVGVPDIQSPFDIAALIWNKEQMYVAMVEQPEAVLRLVEKCHRLLVEFLGEVLRRYPDCNLVHCPTMWAPPDLGCSLSEDEAGCMSPGMFDRFCMPSLLDLEACFGGLFLHCCADADYQYPRFQRIPRLRALNRVFTSPPEQTIAAFAGRTVLSIAWQDEAALHRLFDLALPDTRFFLNLNELPIDEARRTYDRLRARCPRTTAAIG